MELVVKLTDTGSRTVLDTADKGTAVEGPHGALYLVDVVASEPNHRACPENTELLKATLFPRTSATNCIFFDYAESARVLGTTFSGQLATWVAWSANEYSTDP